MSRYCPRCVKVFPGEELACPECKGATRPNTLTPGPELIVQAEFDEEADEYKTKRVFEMIDGGDSNGSAEE